MAILPLWLNTDTGVVMGAKSRPSGFVKVVSVSVDGKNIHSTLEAIYRLMVDDNVYNIPVVDLQIKDTVLKSFGSPSNNKWWEGALVDFPYINLSMDEHTILTISYKQTQADANGTQATTGDANDEDNESLPGGRGGGGGGGSKPQPGPPPSKPPKEPPTPVSPPPEEKEPYEDGKRKTKELDEDKKSKMQELMDKIKGDEPTTGGFPNLMPDDMGEPEAGGEGLRPDEMGEPGEGEGEGESGEQGNGNGGQGQGDGDGEDDGSESGDGDEDSDEGLDPLEQAVQDAEDGRDEATEAAKNANADEAQEAADKSQEAADEANEIAEQVGDEEAEEMAEQAQDAADEAQEAADAAEELEEMIKEMFEEEEDLDEEDYEEFKQGVLDSLEEDGEETDEESPTPQDLDKSGREGVYTSNYGSDKRKGQRYVNWETGQIRLFVPTDKIGPNWLEVTKFFSGVYDSGSEIVVDRTIEGAVKLVNLLGGNTKDETATSFTIVNGDSQITNLLNKMRMFVISDNKVSY